MLRYGRAFTDRHRWRSANDDLPPTDAIARWRSPGYTAGPVCPCIADDAIIKDRGARHICSDDEPDDLSVMTYAPMMIDE